MAVVTDFAGGSRGNTGVHLRSGATGGKVKDIVSKEKSSNQILDLGNKDEAGESKSL